MTPAPIPPGDLVERLDPGSMVVLPLTVERMHTMGRSVCVHDEHGREFLLDPATLRLDDATALRDERAARLKAVARAAASFELRRRADMRAIARWEKEAPGRELIWPDHADLCCWLMGELEAAEARATTAESANAVLREALKPFGEYGQAYDVQYSEPAPDDRVVSSVNPGRGHWVPIQVGDFRRAATALAATALAETSTTETGTGGGE